MSFDYRYGKSFPGSKKIYQEGTRSDLRVPMRSIELSPSTTPAGEEPNAPVHLYDATGPYTDDSCQIDVRQGLARIREKWIQERGDVESYAGTARPAQPKDAPFLGSPEKCLRAKPITAHMSDRIEPKLCRNGRFRA